ncbi:hypothetical protein [Furfurilactobacillus milii]|uniref:Glycosyltransferase RgtA/B/C/D-like domain-containing protein n=1 Tax=Furfurilactobacillus milii TaxID=2888272 RepID=A0A6N9I0V4_9LACO|nr:hypothetical protein [Furfurilactobacillus milii]MYV16387.1 hypothetical protein [Furfurilactobacillus milii]
MNRLSKEINKVVLVVFSLWTTVVLFGIIHNNNLFLPNGTSVTLFLLLLLVFTIISISLFSKLRQNVISFFSHNRFAVSCLLVALVIVWQVVIVVNASTTVGFDPFHIFSSFSYPDNHYFNWYPNNLFLFFMEKSVSVNIGIKPSWWWFATVSTFLVDFSVVINCLIIFIHAKSKVWTALYIQLLFLLVFPMIIIPYSDTFVMPFVSLTVLGYVLMSEELSNKKKFVGAFIGGLAAALAYLLKPTTIILVIAILLIEFSHLNFKLNNQNLKRFFVSLIATLTFVCIVLSFGQFTKNQTTFKLNSQQAQPALHFVAMGLTGGGGYYEPDLDATENMTEKSDRNNYAKEMIKMRLKSFGFGGYLKFLILKNYNNTSDGTFGWNKEGAFIIGKIDKGEKGFIRSFLYPGGRHLGDFYFWAQVVWLALVSVLLFGYDYRDKLSIVLRLSIIGLLLYLLIFEGGRTRYLIQGMPLMLILFTLVFSSSMNRFRMLIHSLK